MDTGTQQDFSGQDMPLSSQPEKQSFYNSIATALYKLQAAYERGDRATLATLRKAAGKTPEKDPLAWSYALDTLLPDFAYTGTKDEANNAERAAFTALSLYALHQRSLGRPMHLVGKKSLGTAVAELTVLSGSKSIKSRLDALMVARTSSAISYHLRSLISLLHTYEIPLDYAQLASDLWALHTPSQREGVILRWGRDYASALWKQTPTKN